MELVQQFLVRADDDDVCRDLQLFHHLAVLDVHRLELAALGGHLLHDVVRPEDWLQIQPAVLALEPAVEHLLDREQRLFPLLCPVFERPDVRRRLHRHRLDNLIVEQDLNLVRGVEDVGTGLPPRLALENDAGPVFLHLVEGALERVLLARALAHLLDRLDVRDEVEF